MPERLHGPVHDFIRRNGGFRRRLQTPMACVASPGHFRPEPMFADSQALQFVGFYAPLCALCCALALIDLRRGIIPDELNLSLAGLGLAQAVVTGGTVAGIEAACAAAATGVIFWLLRRLYFVIRKRQGLGLGDVKFLAAAAFWVGVSGVPTILLIATLTALAVAAGLQLAGRQITNRTSMPFGPFLAAGLLLTPVVQRWLGTL
jgi:leader peptidase (prepilin peptidase) / N-methyltransferase